MPQTTEITYTPRVCVCGGEGVRGLPTNVALMQFAAHTSRQVYYFILFSYV